MKNVRVTGNGNFDGIKEVDNMAMKTFVKKSLYIVLAAVIVLCGMLLFLPGKAKAASPQISAKVVMLKKGQSYKLKLNNAEKVSWSSSKKKVATVKDGKIKTCKTGTAIVTAKSDNKKYKCTIKVTSGKRKALVAYFSATGNTKAVAKKVAKEAGADIVSLVPKKAYNSDDLDYTDENSRACKEQQSNATPSIATVIKNLDQYDTIYLGYCIWNGKEPGVIRTFLKKADLKGKTIMPFCTSESSGISDSVTDIKKLAKGAIVKNGKNLTNASDDTIQKWIANGSAFYVSKITDEIFARIKGKSFKDNCTLSRDDLRYLHVLHKDLDGKTHEGEMIVNYHIANDVMDILKQLYKADYAIEKIRLVDEYGADDEKSMEDNNSSAFNFRFISHTTKISKHGLGLAVDINTLYNPYTKVVDGKRIVEPITAEPYLDRSADFPYKIDKNDLCYKLFIKKGFEWGGDWSDRKDYQHFEIPNDQIAKWYPDNV